MTTRMISCPQCGDQSPADARFCIACSAELRAAATRTTHLLISPPVPIALTPRRVPRRIRLGAVLTGSLGVLLMCMLLIPGYLADRSPQLDVVARLLLIIGGVQLIRFIRRRQILAGLRAAVICLALVLALITPWMLTVTIVAGALLVILHIVEHRRGIVGEHMS